MPSIGNTLLRIPPGEYAATVAVSLHWAEKKALTFSDQRLAPVRAMGYFSLCPQCSQNTSSGVTTSKQLLQRVNGTAGAAGVAAGACTTAAGVAATGVATTGAGVGTATGAAGTTGAGAGEGATGSGTTTGAAAAATPDATTAAPAAATAPPAADTDEDAGAEAGAGAGAAGRLAKISAGVVAGAAAGVPVTGAEPATGAGAATGAWPSVWVAWRTLSAASRANSCAWRAFSRAMAIPACRLSSVAFSSRPSVTIK